MTLGKVHHSVPCGCGTHAARCVLFAHPLVLIRFFLPSARANHEDERHFSAPLPGKHLRVKVWEDSQKRPSMCTPRMASGWLALILARLRQLWKLVLKSTSTSLRAVLFILHRLLSVRRQRYPSHMDATPQPSAQGQINEFTAINSEAPCSTSIPSSICASTMPASLQRLNPLSQIADKTNDKAPQTRKPTTMLVSTRLYAQF
jgi:hypothetical protein